MPQPCCRARVFSYVRHPTGLEKLHLQKGRVSPSLVRYSLSVSDPTPGLLFSPSTLWEISRLDSHPWNRFKPSHWHCHFGSHRFPISHFGKALSPIFLPFMQKEEKKPQRFLSFNLVKHIMQIYRALCKMMACGHITPGPSCDLLRSPSPNRPGPARRWLRDLRSEPGAAESGAVTQ